MDSSDGFARTDRPVVSVAIPTHGRPEGLRQVLACIRRQTYPHLEIVVSDNASPGEMTGSVVRAAMAEDSRISFLRQPTNRGPRENFRRSLEAAGGEYFMWAADDDLWDDRFIETGVRCLEAHPSCDAWFSSLANIDSHGARVREYPGFSRFRSSGSRARDVHRYLWDPEVLGKANLIYSIYRRRAVQEEVERQGFGDHWGADMCFNLGFLSRHRIHCDDDVLFYKRVVRETDREGQPDEIRIHRPNRYIFPLAETWPYFRGAWSAVRGPGLKAVVLFTFLCRTPIALRNRLLQFLRVP